jgi:hypothetical protein
LGRVVLPDSAACTAFVHRYPLSDEGRAPNRKLVATDKPTEKELLERAYEL